MLVVLSVDDSGVDGLGPVLQVVWTASLDGSAGDGADAALSTQAGIDALMASDDAVFPPVAAASPRVGAALAACFERGGPSRIVLCASGGPEAEQLIQQTAERELELEQQQSAAADAGSAAAAAAAASAAAAAAAAEQAEADAPYFASYGKLDVHRLMLQDTARTEAYIRALQDISLEGKVVMDVGAGTGVLAVTAARLGAAHVLAVEASSLGRDGAVAQLAERNGVGDRVTVLACKVEELTAADLQAALAAARLPAAALRVDAVVSEWMGFYLLHESMLNSVLVARDLCASLNRQLHGPAAAPPLLLPERARIFASPASMETVWQEQVLWWGGQPHYGLDFGDLQSQALAELTAAGPHVELLPPAELLCAAPELLADLDLNTVAADDLRRIEARTTFTTAQGGLFGGFALWFDVVFPGPSGVVLPTGPADPPTHWKQVQVLLPDRFPVEAGCKISARFVLQQRAQSNPRWYNIGVEMLE